MEKDEIKQLLIRVPKRLLDDVEAFQHKNMIMSRNEAIRQLLATGLKESR